MRLVLDLSDVRPYLLYRPRLGAADVLPLLRHWGDLLGLIPPTAVSAPHLIYCPFWRDIIQESTRLVSAWPTLEMRGSDIVPPEAARMLYDPETGAGARDEVGAIRAHLGRR